MEHSSIDFSNFSCTNPVMRTIFLGRGISNEMEINYSIKNIEPFNGIKNIDKASEFLYTNLLEQKKF